jgi:hypothetical protein
MKMREKLRQVRRTICMNRWEIVHLRLEAVAVGDNRDSLIAIFSRGHLLSKQKGR